MRIRIYPYTKSAKSAARLNDAFVAENIDSAQLFQDTDYEPLLGDLLIRWGNPPTPPWWTRMFGYPILNHPDATRKAISKLRTFQVLKTHGVPTVPWTTSFVEASGWHLQQGIVCVRQTLSGYDGAGLSLCFPSQVLPKAAPLYTQFVPSYEEFRIHILPHREFIVQKKQYKGAHEGHYPIRTGSNNYRFVSYIVDSADLIKVASLAVSALGLHFGGVDLLRGEDGKISVLEVNTAPELRGSDVGRYCASFASFMRSYYDVTWRK